MVLLALLLMMLKGFTGLWYIYFFRFILLFSSIIPISLRVNLDMGKTVYSAMIMADNGIPGTVVRSSTIPEELGRVAYLLSDKTGAVDFACVCACRRARLHRLVMRRRHVDA